MESMTLVLVLILVLGAALLYGLIWFFCRKKLHETYSQIEAVLDGYLEESDALPPAPEEETRLSKLRHKAARLARQNRLDAVRSAGEKEAIQSFLSALSHQMKTPLSGVALYSDLLLEGGLSEEEAMEFLLRLRQGVNQLEWMLDSLLRLSRLETGAITLSPIPREIRQTILDSVEAARGLAGKRQMTLRMHPFSDEELCHDRKWTGEALTNLLENAIKYGEAGSEIVISLEQLPSFIKINVSNRGEPIPKEEWNPIFQRFYRGTNARDKEGAGLGLYLTALVMERQGGYCMVHSAPSGAKNTALTTFSLGLPRRGGVG